MLDTIRKMLGITMHHLNDDDQFHCENGPAIIYPDGTKAWRVNGKLHREDGPAFEHSDGYKEWYINDCTLTEEQFLQWRVENGK